MPTRSLTRFKATLRDLQTTSLRKKDLSPIATELTETVYNRIKSGFGVTSDASARSKGVRLKALSQSYIEQRRRTGVGGDQGTPNRSNLTYSGQLLDSLRAIARPGEILLEIENTRRREGKTNRQVARYVREERPFLAMTKKEAAIVDRGVRARILARIRAALRS